MLLLFTLCFGILSVHGGTLMEQLANSREDELQTTPFFKERSRYVESRINQINKDMEEERVAMKISTAGMKTYLKSDSFTGNIGGFAEYGLLGISRLVTMDWSEQDPASLAKSIGDGLVPIISTGLALIPGIGPIIGGIFSGVWNLVSGFLGNEEENPMEKMVNEAIDNAMKQMDKKLSDSLLNVINGKIQRNKYICDKYELVSANFSQNYKNIDQVNDTFRLEILIFMDSCDNFLKDMAESFVHPDYADVLWIPSVLTTVSRVAFITDVLDYGHLLRVPTQYLTNLFLEMKKSISDHFALYTRGLIERRVTLKDTEGFTAEERELCKPQSQLLYSDRSLYPYGVPIQRAINSKDKFGLGPDDFIAKDQNFVHIQAMFEGIDDPDMRSRKIFLLNCIMGPMVSTNPVTKLITIHNKYVTNRSYTFRIIYLMIHRVEKIGQKDKGYDTPHEDHLGEITDIKQNDITITMKKDTNPSRNVLFEADGALLEVPCPLFPMGKFQEYEACIDFNPKYLWAGKYVIDEVGGINILSNERAESSPGIITIDLPPISIYFLGIEIIVRDVM